MAGSRLETVGSVFSRCVLRVGRGQGSQRVTTLQAYPEGTRLRVSEPGDALGSESVVCVYVSLDFCSVRLFLPPRFGGEPLQ